MQDRPSFFRMLNYALDPKGAKALDERLAGRAPMRRESLLDRLRAGRRADRAAERYWSESRAIDSVYQTPLSHRGMDLGHGPDCDCRWCQGRA